ncbi:multicopper oxidase family protein [Neobacillus sp. LXY-4]|uniref:multicopper oxidase family protein n=1 Tax=Neobacillus sp. LXY-4 TaxID=3379826 RepID=UPI003EE37808
MKLKFALLFTTIALTLAACSSNQSENDKSEENGEKNKIEAVETSVAKSDGNVIDLVAKEAILKLNSEVTVDAWTFNGSVPGTQIRVTEGETVKIKLKNELSEPVAIHWHGIHVQNDMDGIPGVTQNAVQPGETFTYEFTPMVPGTYMYHTHQNAVNQLDMGLYGSFIVEPKEKTYDRDYTLMLDEWISNPEESNMEMSTNENGHMNHGEMSGEHGASSNEHDGNGMGHDMSVYDIFTMNGKSGDSIEPLKVKEGEKVRIRLANIGYVSHNIHLHGHKFKVVAIDGQELSEPQEIKDQLIAIAPGERYDIEFLADNPGKWYLEEHGDAGGTAGMKAIIQYEGNSDSKDKSDQNKNLPLFTFNNYGRSEAGKFTLDQNYDVEYTMNLNGNNDKNVWTINGKSFPDIDGLNVEKGDLVKVKLVNNSPKGVDHPMHLHGHSFQVLSKNGKTVEGSPIIKDTINLKPGDEYVVAFEADNPGNWLFHCHDLHHATGGMVDLIKYKGFQQSFTPDPDANNKPE